MLTHIDPRYLDKIWPQVDKLLSSAISKNKGESDLSQLRAQIAYGGAQLLVWQEDDELSVATVEFKQYPNYRSAHVSYLAGKTGEEFWKAFKEWAGQHGASYVECLCGPAEARLYGRFGMTAEYTMMRAKT